MKHHFKPILLALLCALTGCTGKTSTLIEPHAYPPGQYGLYDTDGNQLVGKFNLASDQTFGFEYQNGKCIATTIERLDSGKGYQVEERITLNTSRFYEWRRLDKPTTKPS